MKFAWVSRHEPTPEQKHLAELAEIELVPVGDRDAWGPEPLDGIEVPEYRGVVCVHPLIAVGALKKGLRVGVFENISRPGPGGKPQFSCGRLRIEYAPGVDQGRWPESVDVIRAERIPFIRGIPLGNPERAE